MSGAFGCCRRTGCPAKPGPALWLLWLPLLSASDSAMAVVALETATSRAAAATANAAGCGGDKCVAIDTPTTLAENTQRIQGALDKRGCVCVGEGDWLVQGVNVSSNTTFKISPKARLLSKINVTKIAVVHIDHAEHVVLCGGGSINGHAEEAWSYFSDKDARMSPVAVDGSMSRPHTLLISNSQDVYVHHLRLHNSTDWTFRMDTSSDIFVDTVDIYGDERFPNNDGT
jgi:polygalacturonase